MKMFTGLFLTLCYPASVLYADTNHTDTRPASIVGKTIFKGRAYYDKRVQKKFAEHQKEKNKTQEKNHYLEEKTGVLILISF